MVLGGTCIRQKPGDDISGTGTMSIAGGTVTVGVPGHRNDFGVRTFNMTGGLLILGRNFSPDTESLTGGTIQFTATQTGFQIPQFTYANVILSGSIMNLNLGNGSTVINGDLSITGTTVVSVRAPLTAHTLTLGGTIQEAGTWGGPFSGATNINTTYFTAAVTGDFITVTWLAVRPSLLAWSHLLCNPALPGTNVTFSTHQRGFARCGHTHWHGELCIDGTKLAWVMHIVRRRGNIYHEQPDARFAHGRGRICRRLEPYRHRPTAMAPGSSSTHRRLQGQSHHRSQSRVECQKSRYQRCSSMPAMPMAIRSTSTSV